MHEKDSDQVHVSRPFQRWWTKKNIKHLMHHPIIYLYVTSYMVNVHYVNVAVPCITPLSIYIPQKNIYIMNISLQLLLRFKFHHHDEHLAPILRFWSTIKDQPIFIIFTEKLNNSLRSMNFICDIKIPHVTRTFGNNYH